MLSIEQLVGSAVGAGLVGIALLALLERMVPVVPSYAMLVFLGSVYVNGPLELAAVTLFATFGTTVGAACWYGLGRGLGASRAEKMVARWGRYVFLDIDRYRGLGRRYAKNYVSATFIGQVVPVVRVYLSIPAGVLGVPPLGFAAAVFLGSAVWNIGFLTVGYGLNIFGWDSFWATGGAVLVVVALEGGIFILMRRTGAHEEA